MLAALSLHTPLCFKVRWVSAGKRSSRTVCVRIKHLNSGPAMGHADVSRPRWLSGYGGADVRHKCCRLCTAANRSHQVEVVHCIACLYMSEACSHPWVHASAASCHSITSRFIVTFTIWCWCTACNRVPWFPSAEICKLPMC